MNGWRLLAGLQGEASLSLKLLSMLPIVPQTPTAFQRCSTALVLCGSQRDSDECRVPPGDVCPLCPLSSPLPLPTGPVLPIHATMLAMVAVGSNFTSVGMLDCHCSVRCYCCQHRKVTPGEPLPPTWPIGAGIFSFLQIPLL